jgi:hypothetical protein
MTVFLFYHHNFRYFFAEGQGFFGWEMWLRALDLIGRLTVSNTYKEVKDGLKVTKCWCEGTLVGLESHTFDVGNLKYAAKYHTKNWPMQ